MEQRAHLGESWIQLETPLEKAHIQLKYSVASSLCDAASNKTLVDSSAETLASSHIHLQPANDT